MVMRIRWVVIIIAMAVAVVLGGCSTVETARPTATQAYPAPLEPSFQATSTPVVATLVPASTDSPDSGMIGGYPAPWANPTTSTVGTDYPAPWISQSYPAPWGNFNQLYPAPGPVSVSAQAQPWTDCQLRMGWLGCDPQSPVVAGRLAFSLPGMPAVVMMDLQEHQGWFAGGQVDLLEWSPRGDQLLVGLGDYHYRVYDASGKLVEEFDRMTRPRWQPDNSLGREGEVRSGEGDSARLYTEPDGVLKLLVKKDGQAEQSFELEGQPTDRLYQLIGWVPGKDLVLGQVSSPGNAVLLQGGQLFTIDASSGARADLEAYAPMGWSAEFAWRPGSLALAFIAIQSAESRIATLALLDFESGQVTFPLPEGIEARGLDWHPSGSRLAFAAIPRLQVQGFERAGIYLLNPQTGSMPALTHPPRGTVDSLPRWMPDGETVVFARQYMMNSLEIRAIRVGEGQDKGIILGLPTLCADPAIGCDWRRWAAITPKE